MATVTFLSSRSTSCAARTTAQEECEGVSTATSVAGAREMSALR